MHGEREGVMSSGRFVEDLALRLWRSEIVKVTSPPKGSSDGDGLDVAIDFNLADFSEPGLSGPVSKEDLDAISRGLFSAAVVLRLEFDHICGASTVVSPFVKIFSESCNRERPLSILSLEREKGEDSKLTVVPGLLRKDDAVLVITDTLSDAEGILSVVKAIESRIPSERSFVQAHVFDILAIIDCGSEGSRRLRDEGYNVYSIFELGYLLKLYNERGLIEDFLFERLASHLVKVD